MMTRTRSLGTSAVAICCVILLAAAAPAEAARTHVVQPGETLYRIALRYRVTVEAIVQTNGLADPTRIRPGQTLTIPDQGAGSPKPLPQRERQMRSHYTVQRGDTLYSIARRHGTTVRAIVDANRLRSEAIAVGQQLVIPSAAPSRSARPAPSVVAPPASVQPLPAPSRPVAVVRPQLSVGAEFVVPRPLRVRRGPRTYHTTLALVAAETPLWILSEESGWYEVQLPNGDVGWVYEDDFSVGVPLDPDRPDLVRGQDIVREAMRYLGTPYVWGGESARGMDCSGFVYIVFASRVPGLARMRSFDYYQMGTPVERSAMLPGDLVFFTTYAPGPSHVGIYVGDGRFVHASSGARRVTVSSLDEPFYAGRYLGARRLVRP